ncbi:MAG: hypothetical protein OEW15_14735, partial [Nitrospirota bacterium]|nr:hypothetical protein [Nitrospirota bacterium]
MTGDLALAVPVLRNSLGDLLVASAGIVKNTLREDRIECWPVGEALAFGDLGDVVPFMEMVRVAVNKFVITKENLAFDIRPDGFLV